MIERIRALLRLAEEEPERRIFAVTNRVSRRQFLRTAGVLGLVAPSLITYPAHDGRWTNDLSAGLPLDAEMLNEVFRRVYMDALSAIPDVTPLNAYMRRVPRSLLLPPDSFTFNVKLRPSLTA